MPLCLPLLVPVYGRYGDTLTKEECSNSVVSSEKKIQNR